MEIIMSISPRRLCVVTAACLAFLAVPGAAEALVLDWDSATWSPGSLNNSYELTGDGVNDITLNITKRGNGSNVFATDPTTGTQTPVINQSLTGGLSPVQNSLMIAGNLHTNTDVTVQISFTGVYPGAANVSFTIFDIDITTNSDIISSIYGVAPDGTHVAATISNLFSGVTLAGTGLAQTLTGILPSLNNTGIGNATISFGPTVITDIFFTFSNTAGAPFYQDIALSDITFSPVPEINPAAASAISCLCAVGLTVLVQRRAKLKARLLPPVQP
jgi:hypothetical protein